MAIILDEENKFVTVENQPEEPRALFKNIPEGWDTEAILEWLEENFPEYDNFAGLFDETKAYSAGEYVLEEGVLYKFTADHAAGSWTGEDAEETTVGDELYDLKGDLNEIYPVVQSKNLYDKNTANPQNGKVYANSGTSLVNSTSYAVTGKTPVKPNTQYIFSTGGIANVKYVVQLGGSDGSTRISETQINGAAFTTSANTTFVDFEIFARSHTEEEFTAAINAAQLEEGDTVTPYVPYFSGNVFSLPATATDVGKALSPARVSDGKVIEWQYKTLPNEEEIAGVVNYTTVESPVNLYNKTLAVDGYYFNDSQEKIYANETASYSGYIPVKPNTQYNLSCDETLTYKMSGGAYYEFDENKDYIGQGTGFFGNGGTMIQIQTSATCRYILVDFDMKSHTATDFNNLIDSIMLCYGTQRPLTYFAYDPEPLVNYEKFSDAYQQNTDAFKGKKWLALGTSVTYQDSKLYTEGVAEGERVRGYVGDVARHKAMLVTNEAKSGSTLAGSDDYALIGRYQNLNMGSYDFITLEYGINDFGNNIPVGTAADAPGTSTFAACLKTIIEYALTQNPIVGLIICTDPDVRGTTQNNNNNTLKDYADVMIEIASQYRLPVCDWFYHSGINSITKGDGSSRYFLTQAGTHPSDYGHMRMGAMLNQVFDSLIC